MSLVELFLLSIGLSMDAFAVSVCIGLTEKTTSFKIPLTAGAYFGAFQAIMPIAGFLLASRFADSISAYDHWIAFVLLLFIGGKMVYESLNINETDKDFSSLSPLKMLTLAVATSIDALAIGVSLAFLKVNISSAAALIGITTFVVSAVGVKIGGVFGIRFKAKAEIAGGIILVLIGFKILFEHTGVI